jgi:hypothetical protein
MRLWAVPAGLVLAGAVLLAVAGSSIAATVVAIVLMGSAAVIAVSLVFYAVGRSEDREREREATARRRSTRSPDR